jgi:hypothetical protein
MVVMRNDHKKNRGKKGTKERKMYKVYKKTDYKAPVKTRYNSTQVAKSKMAIA